MAKKNHRQYQNDYPSVTEILGVLRKIGLEMWFKHNTAKFCDEKSKKGREIGTIIHEAIQSYIETGKASIDTQYDVEVSNALQSFMLFKKENPEIKLQRSEMQATSIVHGFNGTIDCIGEDLILDWKTGEAKDEEKPKIYDEYLYQVSAYVNLYNEGRTPKMNKAIIVAIAKDKIAYNMRIMDDMEIYQCFTKVFLPCLSIYNYQKRSK